MSSQFPLLLALGLALAGDLTVPAQSLLNVRVAGGNPGAPVGPGVVGGAGDVWNYFPNLGGRAPGGGIVTNATALVDAAGISWPGVALTLTLSGGDGLDSFTDNVSFSPNPVALMGQYVYETAGTNFFTFTLTGLPGGHRYWLYGMGNGNASGQGTTWWVDAANTNGPASAHATANFSAGSRDATLPGNEGICWIKLPVKTTPAGTLTFRVVRLNAAADGTGGTGRTYLNAFQLESATSQAPTITLHPTSQDLTLGQTLWLTAAVTGTPAPALQWSKNGSPLGGATGPVFSITNVQASDAGSYALVASNHLGVVTSATAIVRVAVPDGFCMVGGATTGGAGGPVVTVSNATDFVSQIGMAGPRVVQVSGVLTIGDANVTASKTIVGLGTNATLNGRLTISGVTNVIVRNLRITNPGNDGISIRDPGTRRVWVDHVTFYDCGDGSCDISQGADYVTVSWCKFLYPTQVEHRFVMIADGLAGEPNSGRITLHHNWWSTRADQRMAASSHARVHYYNNYFNCTNNSYCSNARTNTEILSEHNHYAGVKDPIGISAGTNGKIKTSGNLYANCTGTIHPGTDVVFTPPYAYTLDPAVNVPALVMAGAGAPGPDTVPIPAKVWNGAGANNNLNTAANWQGGDAPRKYDALLFAGNTRLAPNNSFTANTEFTALAFATNAGAFTLGGNALRLGVGLTNDSATPQTINLNLSFEYAADHFTTNRFMVVSAPGGNLVLNGALAGPTNAYNRIYAITKLGPGLLTLAGLNTVAANWNLNGGLIRFSTLDPALPGSLGIVNRITFNGGGLQWAPGNGADLSTRPLTLLAGGAIFDVGPNSVSFANPLSGVGGVTKTGSGTLTWNGNNTYSGPTLVENGVLALGSAGTLLNSQRLILSNEAALDVSARADGTLTLGGGQTLQGQGTVRGSVTAANGATIAPGFSLGTLAITNALLFQAGSTNLMDLDALQKTNDLITGLASVTYGGRLVLTNVAGSFTAGDRFKLFHAGSYHGAFAAIAWPPLPAPLLWTNRLTVDGTIAVVSPVNPTPTNLVAFLTNGNLMLSWPADRTGWRLELQTNSLATGLGTNWFTVPGSATTNRIILPVDSGSGSVFFRLSYP